MNGLRGEAPFRLILALCSALLYISLVDATEAYDAAKRDIEAGHNGPAVEKLQALVKSDPEDYQSWFLLGVASSRQQRFHQAIEAFRRVIELKPGLAEPHNNLAVIYNELGDVRAAVRELEASLSKRPGFAIAEENLADLYVKLALQYYRSALEKSPSKALEQRYSRLLQVRVPSAGDIAAAKVETDAGLATEPVTSPQAGEMRELLPATPVAVQSTAASEPVEPSEVLAEAEVLPQKLPVIDAETTTDFPEPVRAEILAAVEKWRTAWEAQDMEAYFDTYSVDFEVPERFATLVEWKRYKRRVISSKRWIKIGLSEVMIAIDAETGHATVNFFQKFRSNSYNGDDRKRLQLIFDNGAWKIISEVSVS